MRQYGIELKGILQSEISQAEKDIYCINFTYIENLKRNKQTPKLNSKIQRTEGGWSMGEGG